MTLDPSQALEPFRSYLEVLARVHLDPRPRGKLDPADVVQQTLLRACAAWPTLQNPDQPVLLAWLRRILARTLADVVKHYDRDKRAVDLERSLEADLDRSASGMAGWLAADQTSPSQAAQRNEEMLRLADALTACPSRARSRRAQAPAGLDPATHCPTSRPQRPGGSIVAPPGAGRTAAPPGAGGVNHARAQRTDYGRPA
jgi:RNA polymerase sigma-70 factor (subfamily 1)